MTYTDKERAILRCAQSNLSESLTPYADIAREVGCTEEEVLALLIRMRDEGAVRRFGACIKHQRTGWTHNAMVAWQVEESDAERCGELAATHKQVSHCYFRPSPTTDWPYTLYTMVHGRSKEECAAIIEDVQNKTGIEQYTVLESIQELKKISMTYF